jgi:hypothetical protein
MHKRVNETNCLSLVCFKLFISLLLDYLSKFLRKDLYISERLSNRFLVFIIRSLLLQSFSYLKFLYSLSLAVITNPPIDKKISY